MLFSCHIYFFLFVVIESFNFWDNVSFSSVILLGLYFVSTFVVSLCCCSICRWMRAFIFVWREVLGSSVFSSLSCAFLPFLFMWWIYPFRSSFLSFSLLYGLFLFFRSMDYSLLSCWYIPGDFAFSFIIIYGIFPVSLDIYLSFSYI